MAQFRKKAVVVEATQWFKNGDHPDDYAKPVQGFERGHPITYSPQHQRLNDWEGQVVRYFRHPDKVFAAPTACKHCGNPMHDHGWVDTLEGGHIVCPGDWVITATGYTTSRSVLMDNPCKPDIFEATYELVEE